MKLVPFTVGQPAFLGDDTSDENGFEAINEIGGVSIRIRPQGPMPRFAASPALPKRLPGWSNVYRRFQTPETSN